MASKRVMSLVYIAAVLAMVSSLAVAVPIEVGTGQNSAGLYVEWQDGYSAEFLVKFDEPTISGLGLFDVVQSQSTLTTLRSDFGWGVFIDGIAYDGHSNSGYGGGENWWHYWIKNDGQNWQSPAFGAADRVLYNGDMDGWVYGRAGTVPEPTSMVLLGIGGLLILRRKA